MHHSATLLSQDSCALGYLKTIIAVNNLGISSSSRVAPAADVQVIITTVVVVLIPVDAARKAASVGVVVLVLAAVLEMLFLHRL